MYQGSDRRKYKRVKKPFLVNFQIRRHGALEEDRDWDMVAVLNLGAGGILFYYNKKIGEGVFLDLKINYSPEKPPIKCLGKVIRTEKLEHAYMFLIAVILLDMSEEDRKLLVDVVEEYHSKSEKYRA